jgi:hypothetical protein
MILVPPTNQVSSSQERRRAELRVVIRYFNVSLHQKRMYHSAIKEESKNPCTEIYFL